MNMATAIDPGGVPADLSKHEEAASPEALKKEGFWITPQIDMQETFRQSLCRLRRYRIFRRLRNLAGARCAAERPARRRVFAVQRRSYERDDGKVVGAVDPMQTLGASGEGGGLTDLARDVGARLERVLADLPS